MGRRRCCRTTATACHAVLPLRRSTCRELGEDLDEALDDGPGGVEAEVLHLLHQSCRFGRAGGERLAVFAAHGPPTCCAPASCSSTASAANCPDRVAPSTHPAFRPLSVQSPATARLLKPVVARLQAVLVGTGQ